MSEFGTFETCQRLQRMSVYQGQTGSDTPVIKTTRLTLMRHLLLIGGGPIGVASAYI